jgi:LmbE family N-acetylglucosaminyl deacetylase
MIINFKKILFLFAHPDDETLAAGGTINLLRRRKKDVYVAISSTGIYARNNLINTKKIYKDLNKLKQDTIKALKNLNIEKKNIYFGNFSDNSNDSTPLLKLVHWVESLIKKINPDTIFTHSKYCTNIDHKYLHQATIVACRPLKKKKINIITCEIPSSTGYDKPSGFDPTLYIQISEKDLKNKIKSMESYSTEKRKYPHPRSPESLRAYAIVRGVNSYNKLAEAFCVQQIFSNEI